MLSPKENYLRTIDGQVPEYPPSKFDPYMLPFPEELLTPNNLPDGKPFVTSLGVTYVGCKEANNGAMPEPGKVVINDVTKWRDQLKIRDVSDRDWEGYYKAFTDKADRNNFVINVSGGDYFLTLISLLGFEETMFALYEEPEEVKALLDEIANFYELVTKKEMQYLKPDVYGLMDDDAAYRAPFFSLDIYREFFKPYHKRMCDIALENGCRIVRHDCGKSEQFVDDWLEIGVQGWNPFQVSNDCVGIKKKYGHLLTLDGAWDGMSALACTEEELWAKLEEYADTFLPGGRFIFAASAGGLLNADAHRNEIIHKFYEEKCRNYYR
ncbi:MAG: hypothetical protein IKT47_05205 [Oscillospiraceae bacterium]|nr:hypothetical protein [Oscillospiraceae bacterium]